MQSWNTTVTTATRTIAIVCAFALSIGSATAAVIISSGGGSDGKWSTAANWVGGVAPQNGDSVVLTDAGIAPTNVDIVDLDLRYLQFSNKVQNLTLIGNPLKVDYVSNRMANNVIENTILMKSSNLWDLQANFSLLMNGVLGATNDAIAFTANNSGTILLRNTNTWAGGLKANQCTVNIVSDANLGVVPPTNVPEFIDNGAGMIFETTGGVNRLVIHPNRGIRLTNNKTMTLKKDVKLILNQNITEKTSGQGMAFNNSNGGVLELGGSNTFSGNIGNNSASWFVRLKHPWALGRGANENTRLMTQGTYDLMGNNLETRKMTGINGGGWPGVGCLMNSVPGTTCVISNGFYNSNQAGGWFGRGDFVVFGRLEFNSTGTTQPLKAGPGRLVLKSQVCLTNRINIVNGTLVWDYSDAIQDKLPDGQTLRLEGGVLETVGNASAPVVEQIGHLDLTVNALCGANALNIVSAPNQDFTLSLTNILLGRYAEIDFNPQPQGSATVKIATTNPGGELTNGVLRYNTATYKQSTWAIVADGIVTGMPDAAYITDFDAGDLNSHLDVAGVVNVGGSTAMTMRFKSPAPTTLTIAAGKTVLTADGNKNNGAILVAPGAGQVDINGGTIDFGANTVFHIHQFNTNAPLVIAACLGGSNNPGVSKCGPGEVILTNRTNAAGGSNGGYQIHEGIVTVDSIASNGVASSLGRGSANYPIKLGNATLRYIGEGHASDRAFSLLGDGTIEASGAGVLHFTSNGYFMTQASGGDNFITLAGTGTGIVDGAFILRAGAIVKNGPGVWILNSTNNTYYSDTVIKQGSLVVNGSIFYSDCVIKDGALRGTGDWNAAALYVESGGTIAPGASVGTLTFDEVNLAPGSVFEWDVDAGNSSADTLVSRERLNLPDAPNSVTVKVVQVGAASAGTYPLFAFTMLTGDTNALVIDTSGSGYGQPSLAVTGQGISVGMVPEPAMLLGALLGLWAVCRRG